MSCLKLRRRLVGTCRRVGGRRAVVTSLALSGLPVDGGLCCRQLRGVPPQPNATAIFRELHPGIPHKMAVITLGCVPNTEMDFRTFEDLGPGGTFECLRWTSRIEVRQVVWSCSLLAWQIVAIFLPLQLPLVERDFRIRDYEHLELKPTILLTLVELLGRIMDQAELLEQWRSELTALQTHSDLPLQAREDIEDELHACLNR